MKKLTIAIAVFGVTMSTAASANIKIDLRQANQQRLIDAGKRSGKLSVGERNRLTAEQKRIKALENRYARSGGEFTKAEEAQINRLLDQSKRDITRAKHNRVRGRHGIHL